MGNFGAFTIQNKREKYAPMILIKNLAQDGLKFNFFSSAKIRVENCIRALKSMHKIQRWVLALDRARKWTICKEIYHETRKALFTRVHINLVKQLRPTLVYVRNSSKTEDHWTWQWTLKITLTNQKLKCENSPKWVQMKKQQTRKTK